MKQPVLLIIDKKSKEKYSYISTQLGSRFGWKSLVCCIGLRNYNLFILSSFSFPGENQLGVGESCL